MVRRESEPRYAMKKATDDKIRRTLLCLVLGVGVLATAQAVESNNVWPAPAYESGKEVLSGEFPPLDESAVLSDYLAYAALANPGLEAAFNRWKAAVAKAVQVDALPNPKFTFGYFIEEVETRVGPQEYRVGLSQMFPWFGKLKLRGDVAAAEANAAFEQYQAVKLDLFAGVKRVYYEYYYLGRAISITEDNIELLKHLEGVARSKLKAGASQSGVIKAQVELGKLDDRLRSFQDMRGPMVARLNASMNRPRDASLPWPRFVALVGAEIQEEEMFEQLAAANPELKSLDSLIQKEEQAIRLARKEYYPDFALGVDFVSTDEALMSGVRDSGRDPVVAMIALDIPIWRGKYKAGVQETRRRLLAAELTRENRSNLLEADLRIALFRFRDTERKINLYGDTLVPLAGQALNVTEEAYRSGSADFLNLIDAERLLLEFQLAHERALADREIALAEVEKLVGRPLGIRTTKVGETR